MRGLWANCRCHPYSVCACCLFVARVCVCCVRASGVYDNSTRLGMLLRFVYMIWLTEFSLTAITWSEWVIINICCVCTVCVCVCGTDNFNFRYDIYTISSHHIFYWLICDTKLNDFLEWRRLNNRDLANLLCWSPSRGKMCYPEIRQLTG